MLFKCQICNSKTTWYGWLHGWLCTECDADMVKAIEEAEDNNSSSQEQGVQGTRGK